jgi:excinuclease ABC subunit C
MKKKFTYTQESDGLSFDRNCFYPGDIPAKAGVYVFRDRFSKIIYIGKAANLRKRMSSYFQPSRQNTSDPKLRSLIKSIYTYEYYPVKNESESLILESRLIKEYSPRYNVLMRDDKRFLLVKIDIREQFPGLRLARVRKNDGCRYFGPFPKSGALRKTVDFLVRRHELRVCHSEIPTEKDRKHCLARIVKDCCEPCVGKTTREEYMKRVSALMEILEGKVKDVVCEIRTKMAEYVEKKRYEKAAEYRDMADNIEEIFGNRNRSFRFAKIAGTKDTDAALFDLQEVLDLPAPPRWIECFDISNIGGSLAVAGMVCFTDGKPDSSQYRRFRIRGEGRGNSSEFREGRGEEVVGDRLSVTGGREEGESRTSNSELNTNGQNDFVKSELKSEIPTADHRFPIPDYPLGRGGDDFAMMAEAVSRRYRRLLEEGGARTSNTELNTDGKNDFVPNDFVKSELKSEIPTTEHRSPITTACSVPDLIMVDGGKGQLSAAIKALKKIGCPFIPIIGLAKKNEEIFIPGQNQAIVLNRHSSALKLLQAIRDETHRFAIAYHRNLRNSRIEESLLDDIPGIGPERKKALLKGFGSLKKLRKATPEDIIEKVPGIGAKFAEIICRNLS